MDIASFAGFASAGPVGVPVAVENLEQFRDLYGDDLPLVWDAERNEITHAYLGACVEQFFNNGGSRCWILRLARNPETARFPIPGLSQKPARSLLGLTIEKSAIASARSPGSWADNLLVSTVLNSAGFHVESLVFDAVASLYTIELLDNIIPLAEGDLLRFSFDDRFLLLLFVDSIVENNDVSREIVSSTSYWFEIKEEERTTDDVDILQSEVGLFNLRDSSHVIRQLNIPALEGKHQLTPSSGSRLSFDLYVWKNERERIHLHDLTFDHRHARFWEHLPTDQALYNNPATHTLDHVDPALLVEVKNPRFPLAGPQNDGDKQAHYLPIGMLPRVDLSQTTSNIQSTPLRTRLERDGLATFDSELFLDMAFQSFNVNRLKEEIEHSHDIRNTPLEGFYSLFPKEEITLVAIPDAVHRGWKKRTPGANEFEPEAIALNSVFAPFEEDTFAVCHANIVTARLQLATDPLTNQRFLRWSAVGVPGAVAFSLEESDEPSFLNPRIVFSGQKAADLTKVESFFVHQVSGSLGETFFYRIRREENGITGMWSNIIPLTIAPDVSTVMVPTAGYDNTILLDVHRALLRFCAARGDMLAVLTLPLHYREQESLTHKSLLLPALHRQPGGALPASQSKSPSLRENEMTALSYGALYHPWICAQLDTGGHPGFRPIPADGTMLGSIAAASTTRGAWVTPANMPLKRVFSFEPVFEKKSWQQLFNRQINVIRREPEGFMLLSADTLSPLTEWRALHVRRLIILLRRLALQEGSLFVFEMVSSDLRRQIQYQFEQAMDYLFKRGAFAGNTPEEAYRVIVDDSVNTPQSIVRGRLVIELQFAPSHPLSFITVRLIEGAAEGLIVEEV